MMRMIGKKVCGCLAAILAAGTLMLALSPTALADTDESTFRMAKEPDQLVLQLGVRWAGVEFQLRTDAGIFPVPVVVNESGVLTMDLGGSTTYTLTCMDSTVPIPDPEQSQAVAESEPPQVTAPSESPQPAPAPVQQQAPMWPVIIFVAGLAAAGGAFAALQIVKRRQQDYDDWADDEEE